MESARQGREQMESLQAQVAHMASPDSLNVPDIFQRAFYQALLPRLGSPAFPVLNDLINEAHEEYPERSPKNLADNIQRCDNNYNLRRRADDWRSARHRSPRDKSLFFEDLETDPDEQAHFSRNIDLNVQTNVPDRGLLLKAAALLLGHQGPLRMLDVGCSRHHISKKLASPADHPFAAYRPVDVMAAIGDMEADHVASMGFNRLINDTPLPIASSIGIDLQDMLVGETRKDHDKMRDWARSCFYPSEYFYDQPRIDEFDHWEETSFREVQFFQDDVTALDHDRFGHYFPYAGGYDLAYFSTVGYQLGETGMKAAIENIRPYLRGNGMIYLQDFVEVDDDNSLQFLTEWPKGSYALYGLDLAREEDGFQKLFTVESGRVGKVVIEPALGKSALAQTLQLSH